MRLLYASPTDDALDQRLAGATVSAGLARALDVARRRGPVRHRLADVAVGQGVTVTDEHRWLESSSILRIIRNFRMIVRRPLISGPGLCAATPCIRDSLNLTLLLHPGPESLAPGPGRVAPGARTGIRGQRFRGRGSGSGPRTRQSGVRDRQRIPDSLRTGPRGQRFRGRGSGSGPRTRESGVRGPGISDRRGRRAGARVLRSGSSTGCLPVHRPR